MQKIYLIWLILPVILIFSSCEKEIKFKGEEQKPLLVLNGFLTPDSVVQIHLSRSRFILDRRTNQYPINDATVELYVNGQHKETLLHRDWEDNLIVGYYRGTYKPREQDIITIRASAPGLQPVKAETTIPSAPRIELADSTLTYHWEDMTNSASSTPSETYKTLVQTNDIRILLKDDPEKNNAYFLKVDNTVYHDNGHHFVYPSDVDIKTIIKGNITGDTSDFLEEFLSDDEETFYRRNLFSDTFFNGRNLFLDFQNVTYIQTKKYRNGKEVDSSDEEVEYQYTIALSAMSEEYYRFIITSQRALYLKNDPFADPVQVTSNVENGTGLLGSYTTSKFVYRFKAYYSQYYH